jgi:anthranilate synthase component 1
MEIIADLECEPRGIYGGAVGYFDLSGNMDFAIAIRTMMYKNSPSGGIVNLRAGAGIVYDSKPTRENLECHNKARAPLTALAI